MTLLRPPGRLHTWHAAMARRIGLVALVCAVVVALLGLVAARTHVDSDVASMLPGGPGSPREAAQLLSEFGALDTLLVDLEMPTASPEALVEVGTALAVRLRASGMFAEVFEGPSSGDLVQLGRVLLPKRLYLFDDPTYEIESRLAPERLKESLAGIRLQLASPQAIALKGQILGDPLGLNAALLGRLGGQFGSVEYVRGHLLSADRHHLLLVTQPKEPALKVDASRKLLDLVSREAASLPSGAIVHAVGGPRFAAESVEGLRHDVVFNFLTSLLAIAVFFLVRFRSLRILLLTQVPLIFGVLAGIAGVSILRGHVHGLTLGFGAALVGIAVDYPTYYFNRASVESGDRGAAARIAVEEVWESLWLGFLTTALAFVAMLTSPFPALHDLALFAGIGISAAFAVSLVLLPPLYARFGREAKGPSDRWAAALRRLALPGSAAVAILLALTVGSAALLPRVRYDGELRHLDAQRAETAAEHQAVLDRFGQLGATSLVAVTGTDEEEALAQNDAVARWLGDQKKEGQVTSLSTIGTLLPSLQTQRERAGRLVSLDIARGRMRLAAAATEAGFSANAFDAFWDEVDAVAHGRISPLAPSDLSGTSLERLIRRAIHCGAAACTAVTAFQRAGGVSLSTLEASRPNGARIVDGGALAAETMAQIPRQLLLLCGLGLASNILVLIFAYRSLRLAIAACLPCLVALLFTVAMLAAVGIPLNLVSASALVLVLGCGVDYGIFALGGLKRTAPRPGKAGIEAVGVLIAVSSTLCGFGTLAMAQQPAMKSLGIAVGLGILVSGLGALLFLPGLYRALFGGKEVLS